MHNRHYHEVRERQCREMAEKAIAEKVREAHIELAEMHHRLAEQDNGRDTTATQERPSIKTSQAG